MAAKLALLQRFAAAIRDAYAPIARGIDAVVEALNVTGPDAQLKRYIERVVASLNVVEKKIKFEERLADRQKEILPVLAQQITKILKLEHGLRAAEGSPSRDLIFAINRLNSELERLFAEEQSMLRKAA